MKSIIPLAMLLAVPCAAPPRLDRAGIDARIAAWQPTAEERRWESIGWARDIREALRLASRHNRPVFLFTHDGRLNKGRC